MWWYVLGMISGLLLGRWLDSRGRYEVGPYYGEDAEGYVTGVRARRQAWRT